MCGQPWKKVTRWNDVGRSFIREQQLVLDVSSFSGLAQGRESYSTVSGQRCLNGVFMSPGSVGGALANKADGTNLMPGATDCAFTGCLLLVDRSLCFFGYCEVDRGVQRSFSSSVSTRMSRHR